MLPRKVCLLILSAVILMLPAGPGVSSTRATCVTGTLPDPSDFVSVIDNPYFPLPVGRIWVYSGVKDGQTQIDTVTVTNQTKTIQGIVATVVSDVATHGTTVLERTFDWYAQDKEGN